MWLGIYDFLFPKNIYFVKTHFTLIISISNNKFLYIKRTNIAQTTNKLTQICSIKFLTYCYIKQNTIITDFRTIKSKQNNAIIKNFLLSMQQHCFAARWQFPLAQNTQT